MDATPTEDDERDEVWLRFGCGHVTPSRERHYSQRCGCGRMGDDHVELVA